ncbi:ras-related protein Rab-37 isoform X1 [Chroicocephalus ridibundus]|uniref:ras-related protein Rab-37 isoform X1 n=1 Tax=Chroicocephalus ridibundus TaxID=1192867 RepID=UPI002FDED46C
MWAEVAPHVPEPRLVPQEPPGLGVGQEPSLLAEVPAFPPALLFCSPPLLWLGAAPLPCGIAWLCPRGSHPTPSPHGAPQTLQDQPQGKKQRDSRNWGGGGSAPPRDAAPLPVLLTPLPAPILQVMLLGDSGVGKTCFLLQFKDGAFLSGTFIATVGIDFRNKVVAVDGVKVKLQIWDTAGQERFRSVTHAYYRDAQALLLLYDITSKMSFDNIRAWLTEIHEYAQKDVVIMLLGNKADVSSERVVRTEDGASLAREYGVPFMETSAKTGMNVELAFLAIAKELKQRAVQPSDEPRFQIHDYIESQKKKSSCCAFA